MTTASIQPARPVRLLPLTFGLGVSSLLLIPINFVVWLYAASPTALFYTLASLQLVLGLASAVLGIVYWIRAKPSTGVKVGLIFWAIGASLVGLGGPVGMLFARFAEGASAVMLGGAWGRPLRVRGRQLHPELRHGADWTRGARPSVVGLDAATRIALEALWLHDAQKEHASVPAFSRVSWLLAAIGAPAELLEGAHRAALEEIEHARRCFALAAGYGGRSHSVEGMPDLLQGGLDIEGDARVAIAIESLRDGCLLEDFNADVAARCAEVCTEAVTRDVLVCIAREERSHADFSWDVLAWLLERWPTEIGRALRAELAKLETVARPTAVSSKIAPLVAAADPVKLREHGRLADEEWAQLWHERLFATRARAEAMLAPSIARDAA